MINIMSESLIFVICMMLPLFFQSSLSSRGLSYSYPYSLIVGYSNEQIILQQNKGIREQVAQSWLLRGRLGNKGCICRKLKHYPLI
jgi:hypothetical protein